MHINHIKEIVEICLIYISPINQSLNFFDKFYVSDNFGSDHSSTITTLNIVPQSKFDLKAKINFQKFNKIVKKKLTRIQKLSALSAILSRSRRIKSAKRRTCIDHSILATEVVYPTKKISL